MKKDFLLFEEPTNPETFSFFCLAAHGFCTRFLRNKFNQTLMEREKSLVGDKS